MKRIFDIKDKNGISIYLTDERWRHIVKEHSGLTNSIEEIKENLLNPLVIRASKYDSAVRYYYRFIKQRKEYLLVAVKYLNGEGFVITAYYLKGIKV